MNKFSIGVDLGCTNLRIAAVDGHGTLIEKVTLATRLSRGREHVIAEMCDAIQSMSDKFKSSAPLQGIGIGVPGIIDVETGLVRDPNLPDWVDYPVHATIEKRLNTVVIFENDANVAALGEKWLGAAKDFADMAMLTLGTGVGGGLVLQGALWRGANGMAGEFGHVTVEPEGELCTCGNRGCLELYASATGIVRQAREAIASNAASALARSAESDSEFNAKSIFDLAMQGDGDACRIFRFVGRRLGIELAGLVNSFNLPIYVIGGGVASAWDAFAPSMFEELRQRSMVYSATVPHTGIAMAGQPSSVNVQSRTGRQTIIARTLLGGDAGLYGAARLPMLNSQ
jgi:glucokinase